jgi:hypothetical protein
LGAIRFQVKGLQPGTWNPNFKYFCLAQHARFKPASFQAVSFQHKGRRPDLYQPGAARQVKEDVMIQGLKARATQYRAGFQPLIPCSRKSLGRCPRLVWDAPSALIARVRYHSFRRLSVAIGTYRLKPVVV